MPLGATIVTDITTPIRPYGHAIRATTERRNHGHCTVWLHAAQRLTRHFDEDNRAIRQRHRPLGKAESVRHFSDLSHACISCTIAAC
jgi:hypothetical protein